MDLNSLYTESRDGNEASTNELFRNLYVRFRLFVSLRIQDEEDGKEVVQEALMAISKSFRDLDIEKSFSAWAYKVLKNRILSYYRDKKREKDRHKIYSDNQSNLSNLSSDPVFENELLNCIKLVAKKNRRFARILNLKYHGYSIDEIARKLTLSPNNLYVIVSRARSMLSDCLKHGD